MRIGFAIAGRHPGHYFLGEQVYTYNLPLSCKQIVLRSTLFSIVEATPYNNFLSLKANWQCEFFYWYCNLGSNLSG